MLSRLEKIWRGFGTALFLSVIGIVGTMMAVTLFPVINLITPQIEVKKVRIQKAIQTSFKLYCWAIHFLRIADIKMIDAQRLQELKGVIIVANHPSLLDVVMIMTATHNVQCVVKAGLWRNPFFRLVVQGAGYISNDLDSETLMQTCVDALQSGNNLIIFPEGTRSVRGQAMHLHRGFANIATMANADLQLVTITCDPPALHKGNPWWRVPPRRPCFRLKVGDRLDIKQFMMYPSRPLAARKIVSFVKNYYADALHG